LGLIIAGVGAAIWLGQRNASDDLFAQCRTTAIAGGSAEIGGPFTLVSETGETVTDQDVITMPSLLYFGYTFCPDVCPLDTVRNAEAVAISGGSGRHGSAGHDHGGSRARHARGDGRLHRQRA
jgi:protein SCO1/2